MVFVDGKLVHHQLSDELKAQGVIFADLLTACTEHEALVRPNLMTKAVLPADGKFAALHGALWTYGVFVYVPKHKVAELPLHIVMYNTKDGASLGHVLVVVEENAQATVQVEYASAQGQAQSLFCGATELLVGDYANLRYVTLQDWNRQTYDISHHRARIGREANLDWIAAIWGHSLPRRLLSCTPTAQRPMGASLAFSLPIKTNTLTLTPSRIITPPSPQPTCCSRRSKRYCPHRVARHD